jgi:hypothetical protein
VTDPNFRQALVEARGDYGLRHSAHLIALSGLGDGLGPDFDPIKKLMASVPRILLVGFTAKAVCHCSFPQKLLFWPALAHRKKNYNSCVIWFPLMKGIPKVARFPWPTRIRLHRCLS